MSHVQSRISRPVSGSGTARSTHDGVRAMGEVFDRFRVWAGDKNMSKSPQDRDMAVVHLMCLARRKVFEGFADFMVQVDRTGTGAELAATSVISYLRCALRETQKRFEERRAKMSANDVLLCNDLFSCLIPNSRTAEGQWLRRTIANIEYWGFERVLDGTAIDHAAVPLSIGSIRYLATGYALGRRAWRTTTPAGNLRSFRYGRHEGAVESWPMSIGIIWPGTRRTSASWRRSHR